MWEAAGTISPQAAGRVEPEQQGWLQLSAPQCLISAPRLERHLLMECDEYYDESNPTCFSGSNRFKCSRGIAAPRTKALYL